MASGDLLDTLYAARANPPSTLYAPFGFALGGSTPVEALLVCLFDPSTVWYQDFEFILPPNYAGGGLTFVVEFSAETDNNSAHQVVWGIALRRIDSAETFSSSHSYSYQTVTETIPNATDKSKTASITMTHGAQMDSLAAGERAVLRIKRIATDGSDDCTGNVRLHSIQVKET